MVRRQLGTCFGKMLGTVATPIGAIQCDAQNVDDPGDGVLALIDQCVAQGAQFAHRVRQSRVQDFKLVDAAIFSSISSCASRRTVYRSGDH